MKTKFSEAFCVDFDAWDGTTASTYRLEKVEEIQAYLVSEGFLSFSLQQIEDAKKKAFQDGDYYGRAMQDDAHKKTVLAMSTSHASEIERLVAKHDLEVSQYETERKRLEDRVSSMNLAQSPLVTRISVGRGSGNIAVRASPRMPSNFGSLQLPTFGATSSSPVLSPHGIAAGRPSTSTLVSSSPKRASSLNTRAAFMAGDSDDSL